jgi:thioredoxin-like negative regulator of GroEL
MLNVTDLDVLQQMKAGGALFILFGGEHCNVCQTLRPQLAAMLEEHFPKIQRVYIDCEKSPDICAQHCVFSLPVVNVYIEGMLVAEEARAFSLSGLMQRIERPYVMWQENSEK